MFELYAFLSLMSLGYVLSKNSTSLSANSMSKGIHIDERPSPKNIYHSDRVETIQKMEHKARRDTLAKAESNKR